MVSDETLDKYRVEGIKVRVVRDDLRENDVRGIVVAWDERSVLIRRPNRRVVKLSRDYIYQPASEPRKAGEEPVEAEEDGDGLDSEDYAENE